MKECDIMMTLHLLHFCHTEISSALTFK